MITIDSVKHGEMFAKGVIHNKAPFHLTSHYQTLIDSPQGESYLSDATRSFKLAMTSSVKNLYSAVVVLQSMWLA